MILDIVTYPDPRLKEVCEPVAEVTDDIRQLAADMGHWYKHYGRGAALQLAQRSFERPWSAMRVNAQHEVLGFQVSL